EVMRVDVLHLPEVAYRQLADPPRPVLGGHHRTTHVGVDAAGGDRVDSDAVGPELVGHRASERLDGTLGRGVGGEAPGTDRGARGDDLLRGGAARVVVHDEVGALAPEGERDRAAEATTRSGHQRYASVQASHVPGMVASGGMHDPRDVLTSARLELERFPVVL